MEPHWLNGRWMAIWTSKKKKKKRKRLIHRIINIHGFPSGTSGKGPACQCRRHKKLMGSIHGSGRFPGGGHGNWFQYSCLENPGEPGGLQSIGSERVGHDWNDLAAQTSPLGYTGGGRVGRITSQLWRWFYTNILLWKLVNEAGGRGGSINSVFFEKL